MIGDFLRDIRSSRGLTQNQLAEVAGLSQPNLSAYETGRRVPTAETLNRIVVACGYLLTATAGDRSVVCPLPRVGWFPDEDLPPRLPGDPADEAPAVDPQLTGTERNRVFTELLHAFAP